MKKLVRKLNTIDVDDPATWPWGLRRHVRRRARELNGSDSKVDLPIDPSEEVSFRAQFLRGRLVRAFHCTRLLDHEVETIRNGGLALLSEHLVETKIARALEHGSITQKQRETLERCHVYAKGEAQYREGAIAFGLSQSMFEPVGNVYSLLSIWGGEALNMFAKREFQVELERLGRPAVVVARLDLTAPGRQVVVLPGALKAFIARVLDLEDQGAEVHYNAAVLAKDIEAIWLPGDPEYDSLSPDMPR